MAAKAKAQWAQLKVGLLAVVAVGILATLVFLMSGSQGFFKTSSPLVMYLDDSAAIAPGAPVRLNGILVGQVSKATLSGMADPKKVVRLELLIQNQFLPSIPSDSEATMAQETLLSTKFINIHRGASAQAVTPGMELKSQPVSDINDVLAQGTTTLQSLENVVKKLDDIASQVELGKGNLGKLFVDEKLYAGLLASVAQFQKIIQDADEGKGNLGKILKDEDLYDGVKTMVARTNTLLDTAEHGAGTVGRLMQDRALYDESVQTMHELRDGVADVRKILADLNAGKGSAGRFLKSDELAQRINGSMDRMDAIMDKLNRGEGTLGQLLVNPSLYESLEGTSKEMNGLMKDFHANPKKFLTLKLQIF